LQVSSRGDSGQFKQNVWILSLTPRFSAVENPGRIKNRFNGFGLRASRGKPLKRLKSFALQNHRAKAAVLMRNRRGGRNGLALDTNLYRE
jgi:hypothetical protein